MDGASDGTARKRCRVEEQDFAAVILIQLEPGDSRDDKLCRDVVCPQLLAVREGQVRVSTL